MKRQLSNLKNTFLLGFLVFLTQFTSAVALAHTETRIETAQQEEVQFNFRIWQPPFFVPFVPSNERNDAMWTNGQVIFHNPYITSRMPPEVFYFIFAHEFGHVALRTGDENAADAFAARAYGQTDKNVCAMQVWFMNAYPNGGDQTHPPTFIRAQNIARECGL